MDPALAETVVHETRQRAAKAAEADLQQQCRNAVRAGREESRLLIKTSRIDQHTGEIHFNQTSRLLRDWYVHVYLNTLRGRLGQPADPIDAQQVEDTTARAHRITEGIPAIRALHAVAVVRRTAEDDASHAAVAVAAHLHTLGETRALHEVPESRFDADVVRVHVTRHWYLRCYLEQVERATQTLAPLSEISRGEEHLVAQTLQTRTMRRVIGRDGIPLVTRHGMLLNDIDRQLATGATGIVPGNVAIDEKHTGLVRLQSLVVHNWSHRIEGERRTWASQAGIAHPDTRGWEELSGEHQAALIRRYLDVNRSDIIGEVFDRPTLRGEPADAARRMFNHSVVLSHERDAETTDSPVDDPGSQPKARRGLSVRP